MVGDEAIPQGSEKYQRARAFFRANLQELIARAQKKNVKVLLGELVSNVRDQEPFLSLYSQPTGRTGFEQALAAGRNLEKAGKYHEALVQYDALARIDPQPATLHFRRGRCLEAKGDYAGARSAYERARDLDGLRFRAGTEMNQILREVAQSTGAPIAAPVAAFEQESPQGLIGNNLMLDHLHSNLRGYFIMAREIARVMQQHGFIAAAWENSRARADSIYWQECGVTPLDEEMARIRIAALVNSWPFVPKASARPFVYTPRNDFEQLAYTTWQRELTWEQAHVKLAETYTQQRRFAEAAREYEALINVVARQQPQAIAQRQNDLILFSMRMTGYNTKRFKAKSQND